MSSRDIAVRRYVAGLDVDGRAFLGAAMTHVSAERAEPILRTSDLVESSWRSRLIPDGAGVMVVSFVFKIPLQVLCWKSSARRLALTRSSMSHPRLSPKTQAEIVHLLSRTGLTQTSIAAVCDVAQSTVCRIAREIGIAPRARKGKNTSRALASRNREIAQLAGAGISYAEIGRRFGISRERTRRIVERYASLLGKSA
jgi:hypothetical protein